MAFPWDGTPGSLALPWGWNPRVIAESPQRFMASPMPLSRARTLCRGYPTAVLVGTCVRSGRPCEQAPCAVVMVV